MTGEGAGDDRGPGRGPIHELIASVSALLATAIDIGRTRVELLSVELREELHRISGVLLWGAVAVLAAAAGVVFAAFAVILAWWDTHRVLAAVLVAVGFGAVAVVAGLGIRRRLRTYPKFLAATLAELRRDEQGLRRQGPGDPS